MTEGGLWTSDLLRILQCSMEQHVSRRTQPQMPKFEKNRACRTLLRLLLKAE